MNKCYLIYSRRFYTDPPGWVEGVFATKEAATRFIRANYPKAFYLKDLGWFEDKENSMLYFIRENTLHKN